MTPKLSICIPTYNRARFLAQTLDQVIAQARALPDGTVEIVVSDNASPDNTESMVRERQARFPGLTYFCQPENRGPDRNYLQSVALARGEYCWLLGDDDLPEDEALSYLLDNYLLSPPGGRPLDFVLLLMTSYDAEMRHILQRSAALLGVTEDIVTTDVPAFFTRFFQESFLSAFVVKREKWNRVDSEKYVGTGLTYLGITYEYLDADSPVALVARPLVKYRSMNVSWTANTLEIILCHQRAVMDMLPVRYDPVKPAAYAIYEKRTPVTLKMLCFLRSERSYTLGHYRRYLTEYFQNRRLHRAAAFVIALLPPPLMKAIRALYQARKIILTARAARG